MKHSQRKAFCFTICHTDSNQIVHPLTREHYLNAELISMPINKYFNIFSGVQWSFSNRLLQWVWIMHRYLLTYIYISKKKNSADFISSIFIFTLSIYRWCSTNTSKVRFIIGHASWIWPNCTLELIMTNAI